MVFLNDNFCVLENPQTMWTSPASIELCVRRIVNSTLSSVVSEALKPPLAPLSHQRAFVGQGSLPLYCDVAPLWGGGLAVRPLAVPGRGSSAKNLLATPLRPLYHLSFVRSVWVWPAPTCRTGWAAAAGLHAGGRAPSGPGGSGWDGCGRGAGEVRGGHIGGRLLPLPSA